MKYFTVITQHRVLRVRGKSVQHVTQALNAAGIKFQSIHMDREV